LINPRSTMPRLAILLLGLLAWIAPALAQTPPRSVLVLDQSAPGNPWHMDFIATFVPILTRSPQPVSIYSEHLALNRFGGAGYRDTLKNYLRDKYRDRPIGAVVVGGPAALDFVLRVRGELWPTAPIVLGGVDEATIRRLNPPPFVTGATYRLTLHDAIATAKNLVPGLKRIALVGDPFERQAVRSHFRDELPAAAAGLDVIDLTGLPLALVRNRVSVLPPDSAIIYTSINLDGAGVAISPVDALATISETANRPIVIDAEPLIGAGGTGGLVIDAAPIGEDTGKRVLRVLDGEDPAKVGIIAGSFSTPIYDWRELQRFAISESRLPPNSEIRYRPPTMWEQYSVQILAAVSAILVQAALIGWLLYEQKRRQRAEVSARGAMAELAVMNRGAAVGALSASIAHEVRQPLAGISLGAEAALGMLDTENPDLDKVRACLVDIASDSQRAGDVITNVRTMFARDPQRSGPVDINKVISSVLDLFRIERQKYSINASAQLAEGLPPVTGIETQLQQVIMNLFMNAVESMQQVSDRPRTLRVSTERGDKVVKVSVEDSGIGIDGANVDHIFKPMFTTKSRGTGMGLAICQSIIETHRGRIWVMPGSKHGTTFHFVLPAA
jgi:signal transduction histidine kinase